MKKIALRVLPALLLVACLLPVLAACDKSNYRDDLTAAAVMDTVKVAASAEGGYKVAGDSYINESNWGAEYEDMLGRLADYQILLATDTSQNVNEIGILRTKSTGDAKKIKAVVDDYIAAVQARMKPLLESYNPNEIPKLNNAKVTVCGTYVLYTILDADTTVKAHDAFEGALAAEAE